jgi:prevent-host-death family protein
MSATYSKEDIYTATEVVRNFSTILKSVVNKEKDRVVIVKNNKFEAVILHIDEYEKLKDAVALLKKIYSKTKGKS